MCLSQAMMAEEEEERSTKEAEAHSEAEECQVLALLARMRLRALEERLGSRWRSCRWRVTVCCSVRLRAFVHGEALLLLSAVAALRAEEETKSC